MRTLKPEWFDKKRPSKPPVNTNPPKTSNGFPASWGKPPSGVHTGPYVRLPKPYAHLYGTPQLKSWILSKQNGKAPVKDDKPVKAVDAFPKSWGKPPANAVGPLVPIPGYKGMGSPALAAWVRSKLRR